MPTERVLMGKLCIMGKTPGQSYGWLYENTSYLFKANAPADRTKGYEDFARQVVTASVEINKNAAGRAVTEAFKEIAFNVDILPTDGDGFFVPYCEMAGGYELAKRDGTGAVIVWDPSKNYTHKKTADGSSTSYPPWVILAHEMGHAIQLHTSGQSGQVWLQNYSQNQEAVEMDNIGRHETPIVSDLGLKPRIRYKD